MKFVLNEKLSSDEKSLMVNLLKQQGYSNEDINDTIKDAIQNKSSERSWRRVLQNSGFDFINQTNTNSEGTQTAQQPQQQEQPDKTEEPQENQPEPEEVNKSNENVLEIIKNVDKNLYSQLSLRMGSDLNDPENPIIRILNNPSITNAMGFRIQSVNESMELDEGGFNDFIQNKVIKNNKVVNQQKTNNNKPSVPKESKLKQKFNNTNLGQKIQNSKFKVNSDNKRATLTFYKLYNLLTNYTNKTLVNYLNKSLGNKFGTGNTILNMPNLYKLSWDDIRIALNSDIASKLTPGDPSEELKQLDNNSKEKLYEMTCSAVNAGDVSILPKFKVDKSSSITNSDNHGNNKSSSDNSKNDFLKKLNGVSSGKEKLSRNELSLLKRTYPDLYKKLYGESK